MSAMIAKLISKAIDSVIRSEKAPVDVEFGLLVPVYVEKVIDEDAKEKIRLANRPHANVPMGMD